MAERARRPAPVRAASLDPAGAPARVAAVVAYKSVLKKVVDDRPSGTRQRLADALATNRSFVSQITNPAYAVPIPVQHLEAIFEICHFTPRERRQFLDQYAIAHPRHRAASPMAGGRRQLVLELPDLGDARRNRRVDELMLEMATRLARLLEGD